MQFSRDRSKMSRSWWQRVALSCRSWSLVRSKKKARHGPTFLASKELGHQNCQATRRRSVLQNDTAQLTNQSDLHRQSQLSPFDGNSHPKNTPGRLFPDRKWSSHHWLLARRISATSIGKFQSTLKRIYAAPGVSDTNRSRTSSAA